MVVEHVFAQTSEHDPCLTQLSKEQQVGLAFIIVCSFFSFLAVLTTLVLYVKNVVRSARYSGSLVFLKSDIDAYFLSLLVADMLVALGGIFNLKWVFQGRTTCGALCSAQGGLEELGMPAVALSTLAIALHTFRVIFFHWSPPRTRIIALSTLLGIWAFLILLVVIPAVSVSPLEPFFTPAPVWCFVGLAHIAFRAVTYVFAWVAVLGSSIVYGLLFLRLRGALLGTWEGGGLCGSLSTLMRWSRCCRSGNFHSDSNGDRRASQGRHGPGTSLENSESEARLALPLREAHKMLWYPLCYIIIILPLSATRWTSFASHFSDSKIDHDVPFGLTAAAASLFKLGGLVDVLLIFFTRPNILSFGPTQRQAANRVSKGLRILRLGRRGSSRSDPNIESPRDGDGGQAGATRGEIFHEVELSDVRQSTTERRSSRGQIAEVPPHGPNGSQVRLIQPSSSPTDTDFPDDEHAVVRSPDRDLEQRRQLELDLTEELDFYPVSPSSSVLSSSRTSDYSRRSARSRDRRSGVLHPFRLPQLDLPDPRISWSPWVPMQREELSPSDATYLRSSSNSNFPSSTRGAGTAHASIDRHDVEIRQERSAASPSSDSPDLEVYQSLDAATRLHGEDGSYDSADNAHDSEWQQGSSSPVSLRASPSEERSSSPLFYGEEELLRAAASAQQHQSPRDPMTARNRRELALPSCAAKNWYPNDFFKYSITISQEQRPISAHALPPFRSCIDP
ncbi:uncharacterized protein FOMMEDRAFT_148710 [Fomitiporia mediterranea MF3/22]|uniref:uncharacterized protein n=1 Tax=Fomitiporia mediterranea (strain MF3/22) TaxID=694068 RepID=UPI0004409AA0|nr:uncharacterized protein FOMMEDRAFT_148710 [Fomitiporia mediterranea MF3/22]EJC99093.1 hypothetical protein FOMMEDRAFT_148710 [Fomitiporia mediterranea MF3/22]